MPSAQEPRLSFSFAFPSAANPCHHPEPRCAGCVHQHLAARCPSAPPCRCHSGGPATADTCPPAPQALQPAAPPSPRPEKEIAIADVVKGALAEDRMGIKEQLQKIHTSQKLVARQVAELERRLVEGQERVEEVLLRDTKAECFLRELRAFEAWLVETTADSVRREKALAQELRSDRAAQQTEQGRTTGRLQAMFEALQQAERQRATAAAEALQKARSESAAAVEEARRGAETQRAEADEKDVLWRAESARAEAVEKALKDSSERVTLMEQALRSANYERAEAVAEASRRAKLQRDEAVAEVRREAEYRFAEAVAELQREAESRLAEAVAEAIQQAEIQEAGLVRFGSRMMR